MRYSGPSEAHLDDRVNCLEFTVSVIYLRWNQPLHSAFKGLEDPILLYHPPCEAKSPLTNTGWRLGCKLHSKDNV